MEVFFWNALNKQQFKQQGHKRLNHFFIFISMNVRGSETQRRTIYVSFQIDYKYILYIRSTNLLKNT